MNKDYLIQYNSYISHCNKFMPINDKYMVSMISKNANSTIAYISCKYQKLRIFKNTENEEYYAYRNFSESTNKSLWPRINKHEVNYADIDRSKYKTVMIFRNPVERVLSAKRVVDPDSSWEDYLVNVIHTLTHNDISHNTFINQHLLSQTYHIDNSDIDLYVSIKDLNSFLISANANPIKINQTRNEDKIIDVEPNKLHKYFNILKLLYACDYNMISSIPKEKLYVPNE